MMIRTHPSRTWLVERRCAEDVIITEHENLICYIDVMLVLDLWIPHNAIYCSISVLRPHEFLANIIPVGM